MKGKIKVALIRGAYANNYELQNWKTLSPNIEITVFTSLQPLEKKLDLKTVALPSFSDILIPKKINHFLGNRIFGDNQILFGLESRLKEFDILHIADPHYYYSYQAALFKKKHPEKKLLTTVWETIPFNNETVFKKKRLKELVKEQTDLFLCYSKKSVDCLLNEGVDSKKIRQIYLGVDLNRFHPISKNKTEQILLTVGRLVPEKGTLLLWEAFLKLHRFYPKLKLWFVGTGPLRSTLQKNIESHNLKNLVKIKTVPYSEMPSIYQRASLFVFPSLNTKTWEEQYGMALIEALASGLPIVATNTGSLPELLANPTMLTAPNSLALFQKIKNLLDNQKFSAKVARINISRAKNFASKNFAKKISQLYVELKRGRFDP